MYFPPLYLIADPSLYGEKTLTLLSDRSIFFRSIREAIDSGVKLIQYRDKKRPRNEMFKIALKLREMTQAQSVHLIINDEIDLAMAVQADGVHLGQDDFPVEMARRLLGKEATIGLSTHNIQQAAKAASQAVDYIGFGPIFETKTKTTEDPPQGIEMIRTLCKETNLPVYAIGGIKKSNLSEILESGAQGIAVASALKGASKELVQSWQASLAASGFSSENEARII